MSRLKCLGKTIASHNLKTTLLGFSASPSARRQGGSVVEDQEESMVQADLLGTEKRVRLDNNGYAVSPSLG